MHGKSKVQTTISPLPDDWLNLSQTSGLFHLVAARTSHRGHDEKKMSHVTVHQARIFGHIFSHPDVDVRIKRLAHDLDVTPAAASQAVERLVADGLLDRRPDPKDRRAVVITISDKGRQLLDEIKTESHSLLADIYREIGITAEEAATFSNVLAAIHGALLARWRRYISGSADGPSAHPKTTDEGLATSTRIVNRQHVADEPSALRQLPEPIWHSRGYLPHVEHKALQFITYRLFDSVPKEVVETWKRELTISDEADSNAPECQELRRRIEKYSDAGHGSCFLKDNRIASIVQENLLHYDGERYRLIDWCIMPNHVHVLVEVMGEWTISKIVQGWRSFTAHEANKILGRTGRFWQPEYFDRYIRNQKHLQDTISYIDGNPDDAGLVGWRWRAHSGSADGPSAPLKAVGEGLASSSRTVNGRHVADEPSAPRQLVAEGPATSTRIVNGQHVADGPSALRHP